jgi:hypothetical protein
MGMLLMSPLWKKLLGFTVSIFAIGLLFFSSIYFYKKKAQYDYQNQIRESRNQVIEAVRGGNVIIDYERHYWVVKGDKDKLHLPLEIELFVHNKWSRPVNGNLVFNVDIDNKNIEESWMNTAIEKLIKDGYSTEQLTSEEFSKLADRTNAIYHYLKRGKTLLPGKHNEPLEKSDLENPYMFTFRKAVFLQPGEVQRVVYKPDLPYDKQGYALKVKVSDIELN